MNRSCVHTPETASRAPAGDGVAGSISSLALYLYVYVLQIHTIGYLGHEDCEYFFYLGLLQEEHSSAGEEEGNWRGSTLQCNSSSTIPEGCYFAMLLPV